MKNKSFLVGLAVLFTVILTLGCIDSGNLPGGAGEITGAMGGDRRR